VSGIGPKLAITIRAAMPATRWWERFAEATWRGSRASRKSARDRGAMVLELLDKLPASGASDSFNERYVGEPE